MAVVALAIIGGLAVPARAEDPDSPRARAEARRQRLLDELDDARINHDLLELEVGADKDQIRRMMTVLRESELARVQNFSQGPVLGSGGGPEGREAVVAQYEKMLDRVHQHFVMKSKELYREERRIVELEAKLGLARATSASPAPAPGRAERSAAETQRLLDLVLRGIETWQRGNAPDRAPDERLTPPAPAPAPGDRDRGLGLGDAERLLDLVRKGIEAWRREPQDGPDDRPESKPAPADQPKPKPAPDDDLLGDAERLLGLIRRGIESWQGR
jgi:hypothetical protein